MEHVLVLKRDWLESAMGIGKEDVLDLCGNVLVEKMEHAGDAVSFIDRSIVEKDKSWKQLIPYIVVVSNGHMLSYSRGKGGGEERLHSLRSVGFGGHISGMDLKSEKESYSSLVDRGVDRELYEELRIRANVLRKVYVGLVNEEVSLVGQVHIGLLVVLEYDSTDIVRNEEDVEDLRWIHPATLIDIEEVFSTYELWSRMVLENWDKIWEYVKNVRS